MATEATETRVLDHGFVRLIDHMGSDESIEQAARVSYSGNENRPVSSRRDLLRFLMRHRHTSPFEMGELIFHVKMPIFVARQWIRHRTASLNEVSGRYSVLPTEWYDPKEYRGQSKSNKQGSSEETIPFERRPIEADAFGEYLDMIESGVSKEMARMHLPLSTYTEFVWKIDLHNLLHFLSLRLDAHAQTEIRVYAEAIAGHVHRLFPLTWEAFEDYRLNAITLSAYEQKMLGQVLARLGSYLPDNTEGRSDRERREFMEKIRQICGAAQ